MPKINPTAVKMEITAAYIQYLKAFERFKPEFGNEEHIRILDKAGEIEEEIREVKKKIEAGKDGGKRTQDLIFKMRQLTATLKGL